MYFDSSTLTKEAAVKRKAAEQAMYVLCARPIVTTQKQADALKNGLKKLQNIPQKDLDKIGEIGVEEFAKNRQIDKDIVTAMNLVDLALKSVSDFSSKTPNKFVSKAFHNETAGNLQDQYVTLVSQIEDIQSGTHIDMGWMQAFTSVNATNRQALRVRDVVYQVKFQELSFDEEAELTGIGGGPVDDLIQMRRFGGGVKINNFDSQFSIFDANALLTNIRLAAQRLYNWNGYKTLCLHDEYSFSHIAKPDYTGITNESDKHKGKVQAMAHTLNKAYLNMIYRAAQISENPEKDTSKIKNRQDYQ